MTLKEKEETQDFSKIPGVAGVDFPLYHSVPHTSFDCTRVPAIPGMYADVEAGCQVSDIQNIFNFVPKPYKDTYLPIPGRVARSGEGPVTPRVLAKNRPCGWIYPPDFFLATLPGTPCIWGYSPLR